MVAEPVPDGCDNWSRSLETLCTCCMTNCAIGRVDRTGPTPTVVTVNLSLSCRLFVTTGVSCLKHLAVAHSDITGGEVGRIKECEVE